MVYSIIRKEEDDKICPSDRAHMYKSTLLLVRGVILVADHGDLTPKQFSGNRNALYIVCVP